MQVVCLIRIIIFYILNGQFMFCIDRCINRNKNYHTMDISINPLLTCLSLSSFLWSPTQLYLRGGGGAKKWGTVIPVYSWHTLSKRTQNIIPVYSWHTVSKRAQNTQKLRRLALCAFIMLSINHKNRYADCLIMQLTSVLDCLTWINCLWKKSVDKEALIVWQSFDFRRDMTWHDMIWRDMTGYNVTWYDVTWRDMTWHYVTWHDVIWRGKPWHDVTWRDVTLHDVTWRDVTWHDVTWHGLTWHDATWCGMTWHDVAWRDMTWHEVTWCGMTWHDVEWRSMTWHDVAWRDMTWPNVAWRDMTWHNVAWLDNTWHDNTIDNKALVVQPSRDFRATAYKFRAFMSRKECLGEL